MNSQPPDARRADQGSGIHARGLTKHFGTVAALGGVDLDVAPGEVTALLGPNGAGKSTLIRIFATAVLPDAGAATVAGHDVVTEEPGVRRSIGTMLSDERSWYWRLTGRHNLEFFAALFGQSRREARESATRMLGEFGLVEAADRPFGSYSAGMRARLSLARALLPGPRVLLLDEPTRSLDPVASAAFRQTIHALADERGVAILFATHDLHEAAELASQVVSLSAGKVAFRRPAGTSAAELEAAMLASAGSATEMPEVR